MDPQLYSMLRDMRKELTDNHTEVVQRLTAVETRINEAPTAEIEQRVKSLEGWRNKIAGFTVAANMFWVGAGLWAKSHIK